MAMAGVTTAPPRCTGASHAAPASFGAAYGCAPLVARPRRAASPVSSGGALRLQRTPTTTTQRGVLAASLDRRPWEPRSGGPRVAVTAAAQALEGAEGKSSSEQFVEGDLLQGATGGGAGELVFLEVLDCGRVGYAGYAWKLDAATGEMVREDPLLTGDESWVAAFPGFASAIRDRLYEEKVPRTRSLSDVTRVTSLDELAAGVEADPSAWRDGRAPVDPAYDARVSALRFAGELLASLGGQRPVGMAQLHLGWNSDAAQPVWRPFVLRLLERISNASDLGIVMSPAEAGLGLTALIHQNSTRERLRAKLLASFGAQSSIEAQSPYYKLLIGRVLGYREANIIAHVENAHGVLPDAVKAQVDADLAALELPGAEEAMEAQRTDDTVAGELLTRRSKKGGNKKKKNKATKGKGFGA